MKCPSHPNYNPEVFHVAPIWEQGLSSCVGCWMAYADSLEDRIEELEVTGDPVITGPLWPVNRFLTEDTAT